MLDTFKRNMAVIHTLQVQSGANTSAHCCVTVWNLTRLSIISDFSSVCTSPKYSGHSKNVVPFCVRVWGENVFTMGVQDKWNKVSHTLSHAHQASLLSRLKRWKMTLLAVITHGKICIYEACVWWFVALQFMCFSTLFLQRLPTVTNRWWLGGISLEVCVELVLLFFAAKLWCQVSVVTSMGPSPIVLVSISQPRCLS